MSEKRVNKWVKGLAIILLLPASIAVPVLSLESHYTPVTNAQNQPDTAMQQRVNGYKTALPPKISENDLSKIKLRCDGAQANAKTLSARLKKVQSGRVTAYEKIMKNLNNLLDKLDKQAFETTELKANIATLQTKINNFNSDMNSYYLAVNDMSTLNCTADPTAFIGALQAARKYHQTLVPQFNEIRAYITNTIKPTLKQVRTQIEKGQTVGGQQ